MVHKDPIQSSKLFVWLLRDGEKIWIGTPEVRVISSYGRDTQLELHHALESTRIFDIHYGDIIQVKQVDCGNPTVYENGIIVLEVTDMEFVSQVIDGIGGYVYSDSRPSVLVIYICKVLVTIDNELIHIR